MVVPILALGFAVGVERAAAYDVGYDSSCDEIDLIETHGDLPARAHLSRFASLYSTGRVRSSTISYPERPLGAGPPAGDRPGPPRRGFGPLSSFQTSRSPR